MSKFRKICGPFLILAILSGSLWGFTSTAGAERRDFDRPGFRDDRNFQHRPYWDSRYHHDHFYPRRGFHVDVLPPGHRVFFFGRDRYFFFDGIWYRPIGPRFVVVAPPIGLVIPILPPYYSTIWVGGVPYYYANEVYYQQTDEGYMVVNPPTGEVVQTPPSLPPLSGEPVAGSRLFIYPRQGQSQKKQADDRYECHSWAANQTGFDPTNPPPGIPEARMITKRADYQRAMTACLEGRGYTVK
jgi:Family of unknown function (DUF6515)